MTEPHEPRPEGQPAQGEPSPQYGAPPTPAQGAPGYGSAAHGQGQYGPPDGAARYGDAPYGPPQFGSTQYGTPGGLGGAPGAGPAYGGPPPYGPPGGPPPGRGRNRTPLVMVSLLLVAAIGVVLAIVLSGGDDGDGGGDGGSVAGGGTDSPRGVATAFMQAMKDQDLDAVKGISCRAFLAKLDESSPTEMAQHFGQLQDFSIVRDYPDGDATRVTVHVKILDDRHKPQQDDMDVIVVKESGEYKFCDLGTPLSEAPPGGGGPMGGDNSPLPDVPADPNPELPPPSH